MAAETWQMVDPWRAHPDRPVIDEDSETVLEDAVELLGTLRSPLNAGHAGLRIHALASLIAQAEALLPDAVADARERDFHWSEIAADLGISATAARRRYGDYARTREVSLEPD